MASSKIIVEKEQKAKKKVKTKKIKGKAIKNKLNKKLNFTNSDDENDNSHSPDIFTPKRGKK